jgi:hypothetical protein
VFRNGAIVVVRGPTALQPRQIIDRDAFLVGTSQAGRKKQAKQNDFQSHPAPSV